MDTCISAFTGWPGDRKAISTSRWATRCGTTAISTGPTTGATGRSSVSRKEQSRATTESVASSAAGRTAAAFRSSPEGCETVADSRLEPVHERQRSRGHSARLCAGADQSCDAACVLRLAARLDAEDHAGPGRTARQPVRRHGPLRAGRADVLRQQLSAAEVSSQSADCAVGNPIGDALSVEAGRCELSSHRTSAARRSGSGASRGDCGRAWWPAVRHDCLHGSQRRLTGLPQRPGHDHARGRSASASF